MNQDKIGSFIAETRKGAGLTQKELAEKIGVSDKTVSKWECGNGLPDVMTLTALCDTLNVSVNELLSGERITDGDYSVRAEENMMALMEENEIMKDDIKKERSKNTLSLVLGIAIFVLTLLLITGITAGLGEQFSAIARLMDLPSLIILILLCAATWIIMGRKSAFTKLEILNRCIIPYGVLVFVYEMIQLLFVLDSPEKFGPNLAICLITVFYALLIWTVTFLILKRPKESAEA